MFQRSDATTIKSWDFSYDCPQGKGKRKHQAHVAEEEESPPSKKALVEIEDYVL
jgi:hypothetical protein